MEKEEAKMVFGKKRGQAAMEFLMTYGWAILVVLVVIGALAYFGVLSPDTLLPEKCTFPVQVGCKDYQVKGPISGATITMALQNGAGRDMVVYKVNASSDAVSANGCATAKGTRVTVRNGDSYSFTINKDDIGTGSCVLVDTGRSKNRYKMQILYSWVDSQNINHSIDGELLAKIETG